MCEIKKVKPEIKKNIVVKADNLEDLFIGWLQEIIALVDTDEVFLSKFDIKEINWTYLEADCYGEEISLEKGLTIVKAVTYYGFKFERDKKGYKVRVACDI